MGNDIAHPAANRIDIRTILTDNKVVIMKGSEFFKKIKKLGREKGVEVHLESRRGKGSHSTLFYGDKFTIIRNLKDELKTGTYQAMLKQLCIEEHDLR